MYICVYTVYQRDALCLGTDRSESGLHASRLSIFILLGIGLTSLLFHQLSLTYTDFQIKIFRHLHLFDERRVGRLTFWFGKKARRMSGGEEELGAHGFFK